MSENQAGITALISSYARAYHAVHDSPKIFNDYLAEKLFSQPEQTFFAKSIASMLPDVDPELAATHPDQDAALACVMQKMNGPITDMALSWGFSNLSHFSRVFRQHTGCSTSDYRAAARSG